MSSGWPRALEDRYTLIRPLSDGSLARVFAAHDRKHARDVAVKILRLEASDEGLLTRFRQEVRIAAQLSHPHILPLFDSGEVDGAPYFVMPLVDGSTLRRRLEDEGPLPLSVALSIARQVAAALDYAHQHGVVHRDIKPENILLEGRNARVTDFGVAAALGVPNDDRITQAGMVVGTPRYMSPEQASGDTDLDGRTDIYSLGIVLFEMLTGEVPYSTVLNASNPPSLREIRADVPPEVSAAVSAAIALDPAARTRTARDFIDALAGIASATPDGGTAIIAPTHRRLRLVAVASALGVVAVAAALFWREGAASSSTARRWILVAEVEADSADRNAALAMRELALTELAQSQRFSLVPSEQVVTARRNAGIADSVPLLGRVARELATRSTVRVVVEGSLRRVADGRWAITLRAINAEDGNVLVAASAEASDPSFVEDVGRVVRRLRSGLGERSDALEANRPLQEVSTASFPAFLRYQEALLRARSADYDGAVHLAHQAIALDSAFAAAWSLLANVYVSLQRTDSVAWAFARATALPERLSDADRDRLAGDVAFYLEHDPEEAVRAYDRFLLRRPASISGLNNRALFLSALGRHADALAAFRDALTVDPLQVGPRNIQVLNIATELVVLGYPDSAEQVGARLEGSHAQYLLMLRLNAMGRWDSLARVARAVRSAPSPARFSAFPALLHEVSALEALGRRTDATALLDSALQRARGSDARWFTQARLTMDAARGERPSWPLPAEVSRGAGAANCLLRALHAIQRADEATARAARRCIDAQSERDRRALGFGVAYLDAWMALAAAEPQRALQLIAAPADAGEHHPFSVDRVNSVALRLLWERAAVASGDDAAAQAARRALASARRLAPNQIPLRGLAIRAAASTPLASARSPGH